MEDPRINVQSILTRQFLTKGLFGERFTSLMEQELRFGVVMNWLNKLVKTVDDYHWNNLSMSRTKATFERFVCKVQVIHIDTLLISQFGYDKTHNKGAYTFITKM